MECNISSCSKWRAPFRTLRPPCLCFIIPEYMNKEIVEKGSKNPESAGLEKFSFN